MIDEVNQAGLQQIELNHWRVGALLNRHIQIFIFSLLIFKLYWQNSRDEPRYIYFL